MDTVAKLGGERRDDFRRMRPCHSQLLFELLCFDMSFIQPREHRTRLPGVNAQHLISKLATEQTRFSYCYCTALMEDGNSIRFVRLFQQMRCQKHCDAEVVSQLIQCMPQIQSRGWIQSRTRLVQQQQFGTMQDTLANSTLRFNPPESCSAGVFNRSAIPS